MDTGLESGLLPSSTTDDDALIVLVKDKLESLLSSSSDAGYESDALFAFFGQLMASLSSETVSSKQVSALLDAVSISDHERGTQQLVAILDTYIIRIRISLETNKDSDNNENGEDIYKRFTQLVYLLYESEIVDVNLLRTSLDLQTVVDAKILGGPGDREDEYQRIRGKLNRHNTNMVYRQQKYNLYREETEGYSRLMVVLNNMPQYPEDASVQVKQLRILIGQFDLDPNRVLDSILEVFEQQIWNMNFVCILRELNYPSKYIAQIVGFRFMAYTDSDSPKDEKVAAKGDEEGEMEVEGKEKGAADTADGNKEQSSQSPKPRPAPASLYALSSLLIAYEFVYVSQLLPYLKPATEEASRASMVKLSKLKNEVKQFGVISLSGGTSSTMNGDVEEKADGNKAADYGEEDEDVEVPQWERMAQDLKEVYAESNQLIGLVSALLNVRCLDLALPLLNMLKKKGIDVVAVESTRDALAYLLTWMLSDLYLKHSTQDMDLGVGLGLKRTREDPEAVPDVSSDGDANSTLPAKRAFEYVPQLPNQVVKFSVDDENIRNFPNIVSPLLSLLGHHLYHYPVLFTRVCRLLRAHIKAMMGVPGDDNNGMQIEQDNDNDEKFAALDSARSIIAKVLLPALTCTESMPALSNQIWSCLQIFPYHSRYAVYKSWKGRGLGKEGIAGKHVECCLCEQKALIGARGKLKRLTKDNKRLTGKYLAHHATSNPLVVYNLVLNQVRAYDNLIAIVVDALAVSTKLSRDVMTYCVVTFLEKDSKDGVRVSDDDATVAPAFLTLSRFIGYYHRKFPTVELKGLLHYLSKRAEAGASDDLLVLKDLLTLMGGCDSIVEVSQSQLKGLSGGHTLRNEVMGGAAKELQSKTAMEMLRKELLSSYVAVPIILNVAKIRKQLLYVSELKSLKLVSLLCDTMQDLLMQYTEYLIGGTSELETIAAIMPSVSTLLDQFDLDVPVTFQLVRPLLRHALSFGTDAKSAPKWIQSWHPFSTEQIKVVRTFGLNRGGTSRYLSLDLFTLFWTLSMYDIYCPKEQYELEMKRLVEKSTDLSKFVKECTAKTANGYTLDAITLKKVKESKLTNKKLISTMENLKNEQEEQVKHVDAVRDTVVSLKDSFFAHVEPADVPGIADAIVQELVLKRVLMSPLDAVYSIKFFSGLMHDLDVPTFFTIQFADRILYYFGSLVTCSTEAEASFLGYAFNELLTMLRPWIFHKEAFEGSVSQKDGFCATFDKRITPRRDKEEKKVEGKEEASKMEEEEEKEKEKEKSAGGEEELKEKEVDKKINDVKDNGTENGKEVNQKKSDNEGPPEVFKWTAPAVLGEPDAMHLSHESFAHWCRQWHASLCSIILSTLNSSEYIHIRSALIFIIKISEHFPIWFNGGNEIKARVEQLVKEETERADLQLMSKSLLAILMGRSTDWVDEKGKSVGKAAPKKQPQAQSRTANVKASNAKSANESSKSAQKETRRDTSPRDNDRGPRSEQRSKEEEMKAKLQNMSKMRQQQRGSGGPPSLTIPDRERARSRDQGSSLQRRDSFGDRERRDSFDRRGSGPNHGRSPPPDFHRRDAGFHNDGGYRQDYDDRRQGSGGGWGGGGGGGGRGYDDRRQGGGGRGHNERRDGGRRHDERRDGGGHDGARRNQDPGRHDERRDGGGHDGARRNQDPGRHDNKRMRR